MTRALHIASFMGNSGDSLNHACTRRKFAENGLDFVYEPLEIRTFYDSWGNQSQWDRIPEIANQFDVLLIGGGNFFELWPKTRTSCTIDLPPKLLDQIKVPILFYGLGVDPGKGIHNKDKFQAFIDYIMDSPRCYFTVRNDGAKEALKGFGVEADVVPDGGFFYQNERPRADHVAINIAGDMQSTRYPYKDQFLEGLARYMSDNEEYYVLIPHTYADVEIMGELLNKLPDPLRRQRVSMSPYNMGDMFHLYKCKYTLAMRFHANVASLAQGTQTVAFNTYHKIDKLYKGLGLKQIIKYPHEIKQHLKSEQHYTLPDIDNVHGKINQWLSGLIGDINELSSNDQIPQSQKASG